jgi:hypothetical protein
MDGEGRMRASGADHVVPLTSWRLPGNPVPPGYGQEDDAALFLAGRGRGLPGLALPSGTVLLRWRQPSRRVQKWRSNQNS